MTISRIDPTVEALRIALGRAARRAEVAASNLANVDTPGYRATKVKFPDLSMGHGGLQPSKTHTDHIAAAADPAIRGHLVEAPANRMRADGNTVDIDREMTQLAMTEGRFRTAAQMVRKRFALMIYAATDGRS
jgi:flagellar basal-body rod protein FlgB